MSWAEGVAGELMVAEDVAAAFADAMEVAYARRSGRAFNVALSGGSTAAACYAELERRFGSASIDWSNVNLLWGDERCVPLTDEASNYRLASHAMPRILSAAASVLPMVKGEGATPCGQGAVEAYGETVASLGGLDVVHLGVGPDGHTASLFPGSQALELPDSQLVANNSDPRANNPLPRMTLTFSGIRQAKLVVLTVAGASKANALAAIKDGADLPASRVQGGQVLWIVDHQAAPWAA